MKSAFSPLAMARSVQFTGVCATSRKRVWFSRMLCGGKYLIYLNFSTSQSGVEEGGESRLSPLRHFLHLFRGRKVVEVEIGVEGEEDIHHPADHASGRAHGSRSPLGAAGGPPSPHARTVRTSSAQTRQQVLVYHREANR
jgi:hypothetical protein